MAFGYDGSVRIKADLNHNNFDRGLSSMKKQVDSFGSALKRLAGTVAMAFGTAALISFGKESVKLASDIQEVQNVIDVTFGQGAAEIEEFAKSAAEAFGLSELSAKQYTGTMGAMLKSSGLATSAAQEMSLALSGLTGDMASFYNLDTDTAFEKIRSGISGETEPLKQLGINMSVANLEAYALSQGITKSYSAMSQAEQVLLRYNYLLSVTGDAQGDFARTSGSFANQIRLLQLNFDQLRISVGSALIPIAQAVLPSINAIIAGLTKLANVFAQVTALLFGKSAEVKAASGVAVSAGAAADATDRLAESTAGAGGAAKNAAKDMKGVLTGFDELNILASAAADSMDDAAGGMGGAGGIDAGAGELEIPSYESEIGEIDQLGQAYESLGELFNAALQSVIDGLPALRESLLSAADSFNEFNQKLYDAFTFPGVKEKVEQLGRELAEVLNDFVNEIDWELWGRTLGAGLNLGLQFLTEFIYTFDWINLGNKLAELVNGLVYEVDWYDFGRLLWTNFKIGLETFAGFILGLDMPALAQAASDIIMGFFNSMQETIAIIDWAGIGRQIAEFLNGIDWAGVITAIAGAIGELIPAALELIGGFIQNADTGTLIAAALFFGSKLVGLLLEKVVSPIAKQIGSDLIKKIAAHITEGDTSGLVASVTSIFGKIKDAATTAISKIGEVIAKIGPTLAGITAIIGGVVLAATSFFDMWNEGFSWAKEAVMLLGIALTAVGAIILGAPAVVTGVIAGIVAAVATLVILVKEHWEEIKQAFIDAWHAIQDAWNAAGQWFNDTVIQPIANFFSEGWERIKSYASLAWLAIQTYWNAASVWFNQTVIEPIKQFFSDLWSAVTTAASETWAAVQRAWQAAGEWFHSNITDPIARFFSDTWTSVTTAASEAWNNITSGIHDFWENVKSWWNANVAKYFSLEYWKDLGKRMIDGLLDGLQGIFDSLTGWASDVWDTITGAFSTDKAKSTVKKGVNSAARQSGSYTRTIQTAAVPETYRLPMLANGAVIPPNQQFAAILGDQRSGKNIEAPLSTIERALENVLLRNGGAGGTTDVNVSFTGSLSELARILQPAITVETRRRGMSLTEVRT